ncbi:MAG TPA: type II secretory pathway protein ExeA, partial [Isosphaeraceae bacterium]
ASAPAPTPTPTPSPAAAEAPQFVPSRPPLRVEDGLIEVGWEPQAEPASEPLDPDPATEGGDGSPEPIDDHYAALQAWNEWAQNQGRHPAPASPDAEPAGPNSRPAPALGQYVWAEGQQGFAPYSQLFSRLSRAKDAD